MPSFFSKVAAYAALLSIPLTAVANGVEVSQFRMLPGKSANFVLVPRTAGEAKNRSEPTITLINDFATAGQQPERLTLTLEEHPAQLFTGQPNCAIPRYQPAPGLPVLAERRRAMWYTTMAKAACAANVPVQLFDALIIQESRYNPMALSPKGASGLAQLMPASARSLGVRNVWDPDANLRGGARLLRALLDQFGRYDLALAAYNAGTARVLAHGQVPRIPETLHYVSGILVTMRKQLVHANLLEP